MTNDGPKYKPPIPAAQKILLGIMGERIVASLLRSAGHTVEESLNLFDSDKDMLVDGNSVEVKTQVPFMIEDSFGVPPGQLKKMALCYRVYFVSVPLKVHDDLAGGVFEIDLKANIKAHRRMLHNGNEVVCFPRRQPEMRMIHQITDAGILSQLRKLSTSYL